MVAMLPLVHDVDEVVKTAGLRSHCAISVHPLRADCEGFRENVEASTGIEPVYTDLQNHYT
jgi:hypothetical protein